MTDLEDRLRALSTTPLRDPAAPADLRRRAARRTRRRRAVAVAVPLVLAAVAATVVAARTEPQRPVTAGPGTTTTSRPDRTTSTAPTTSDEQQQFGGLTGVELTVSPKTDLRDGDRLQIRVTGFEQLDGAQVVTCAGDVTEEDAQSACDLGLLGPELTRRTIPGGEVTGEATVVASRFISIARGAADVNGSRTYDCAAEPAGCVLVVAPITLPVRGVATRITFADEPASTPTVSYTRTADLRAGDQVAATATGLRPNHRYRFDVCRTVEAAGSAGVYGSCDEVQEAEQARTADAEGRLSADLTVPAGFYGYVGRTDCTGGGCSLTLLDERGEVVDQQAATYVAGESFPVPVLSTDPPGPYVDGQTVTLSGRGLPAGLALEGAIGICPADKDPAIEERCNYQGLGGAVVGADGRFSASLTVRDTSGLGRPCRESGGCLVSWILQNGPAAASVALTFQP